jgi:hypothetical protein
MLHAYQPLSSHLSYQMNNYSITKDVQETLTQNPHIMSQVLCHSFHSVFISLPRHCNISHCYKNNECSTLAVKTECIHIAFITTYCYDCSVFISYFYDLTVSNLQIEFYHTCWGNNNTERWYTDINNHIYMIQLIYIYMYIHIYIISIVVWFQASEVLRIYQLGIKEECYKCHW